MNNDIWFALPYRINPEGFSFFFYELLKRFHMQKYKISGYNCPKKSSKLVSF